VKRIFIFLFSIFFSFYIFFKGTIYIEAGAFGSSLFDTSVRDGIRIPLCEMRNAFIRLGYKVKKANGLVGLDDVACIICFDVPKNLVSQLKIYPKEKLILFLWEPPTAKPYNYDKKYHRYFSKIYTLLDDLVDGKTYFKFYEPQPRFDVVEWDIPFEEKKLSTLLTCNKDKKHPLSLTPERKKLINFFEPLSGMEFDFYGLGWPKNCSKNFKGFAQSKVDCMKNYRFCFCYENMHKINGYITGEKIFNVFVAGCVPIYWGAENITDYVPKNCFIDRRDFKDNQEVYDFIKNMTQNGYREYIRNIKEFMCSKQAYLFSSEVFVHTFLDAVEPGYDKMVALSDSQREIIEWVLF